MHHLSSKKKELIRRIVVYIVMVLSTLVTVSLITFFVLGFRFDFMDGQVEQYGFLQFASTPSGALVTIDGVPVSAKTPTKSSVKPGQHKITMQKTGYETWSKTVTVNAGTLTWLNYTLFVPKTITVEPVAAYDQIYASMTSPKSKSIIIQNRADTLAFDLVDIDATSPKAMKLTPQSDIYSEPTTAGISHDFKMIKWDDSGRYMLVKHTYGDKVEWLSIDTANILQSKNITRTFDIAISAIDFSGTSGNNYFVIESGDIRKLDLSAGTISKVLVSDAANMSVYENTIVYSGKDATADSMVIGVYHDGDAAPYALRTTSEKQIKVATARYFNEDYVAFSEGKSVTVLGGSYPTNDAEVATSMTQMSSFAVNGDIINLGFSPTGQYVLAQSSQSFSSYNLEYQTLAAIPIDCANSQLPVSWLDENYVSSSCKDSLTISEFDGTNNHAISSAVSGQAVALTRNGKYIYSISKTDNGYQLQRVKLIIP